MPRQHHLHPNSWRILLWSGAHAASLGPHQAGMPPSPLAALNPMLCLERTIAAVTARLPPTGPSRRRSRRPPAVGALRHPGLAGAPGRRRRRVLRRRGPLVRVAGAHGALLQPAGPAVQPRRRAVQRPARRRRRRGALQRAPARPARRVATPQLLRLQDHLHHRRPRFRPSPPRRVARVMRSAGPARPGPACFRALYAPHLHDGGGPAEVLGLERCCRRLATGGLSYEGCDRRVAI
jgi:hypothetical protein